MSVLSALKAPPVRPALSQDEAIGSLYQLWRDRVIFSLVSGYAIFYFVRKNLTVAMPMMLDELGMTKTEFGIILTAHSLLYGLSKFLSGILADRANARYFMALGLLFSALMNIFFGLSSSFIFFGIFWVSNALFQGSGVPPCGRMLTYWFSKKESGFYWGIWNASHQIGGGVIALLAAYLASSHGWRSAFFVPAGIALATSLFLMNQLRDRPESLGLPPINQFKGEESATEAKPRPMQERTTWDILLHDVFSNPMIWIVCFANFFVYIVRIGMLDWGVTYLVQKRGLPLTKSGFVVFLFEIIGLFGAFLSGWISDRFTNGKRGLVSIVYMLALIAGVLILWLYEGTGFFVLAGIFSLIGFFVYGPQMLVAVVATAAAGKEAAGTAVGLTGLFGYLGAAACSFLTGWLTDNYGWDAGIILYLGAAIVGTLLFALTLGQERKLA